MASGLILMDQALVGHAIDDRHRSGISSRRGFFVTTFDSLDHLFDVGAHHRARAGIALAMLFRLTCTFGGLRRVSQGSTPTGSRVRKAAYYADFRPHCQWDNRPAATGSERAKIASCAERSPRRCGYFVFTKESTLSKRLAKSTAVVGGNTLISRVLGFVRDMVIARYFGASVGTDAFFVAFKIPNFLRRLFAEGAFSQAFVPVLSEYKTQRDHEAVRTLVGSVSGSLGAVLFVVTVIGVVAAPILILIFAPGFSPEGPRHELAIDMLRLTFPYLFFISLTALAGGVLNTFGRFGVPAFTPVFLNLSLIGTAIWLAPLMEQPVTALAWGVLIAGIAQLAFQLPFLVRLRVLALPKPRFSDEGVRRILRLMLPAIFGVSVTQVNLLIDTLIASFLVTGSISWLYYSDRLVEFPLGVFGIALATVILPHLSRQHAGENPTGFSDTLDWALRWVLTIGLPATLGLAVLAGPLLATLFQYHAFTGDDVTMAARSLMAYSVGLCGFILVKVLAPGYYARQDTRTPVRIGVIAMVGNLVLNLTFVWWLAHAGLALATSLAAFINAGLLFRGLRKLSIYKPRAGWFAMFARTMTASTAMTVVLWWGSGELETWLSWGAWDRALRLSLWVCVGALVYLLALLLLGMRPHHLRAAPTVR